MPQPSVQPALKTLLTDLTNTDYRVRRAAIRDLAQHYPQQAAQSLLPLLRDSRRDIRVLVARTLGQLGDPCAVEPLCIALADRDSKVRVNAIQALATLHDRRAVQPLLALHNHADQETRAQAIWALGNLDDRSVVPVLLTHLTDATSDSYEVSAVIHTLGRLEDERAIAPLLSLLECTGMWQWVGKLGGALTAFRYNEQLCSGLVALLSDQQKSASTRSYAAWFLGYLTCRPAVPALLEALTDHNADVRYKVVEALASLRDHRAIGPLIKLHEWEQDERVRQELQRVLANIQMYKGFFRS